jgi:hypothetical protein
MKFRGDWTGRVGPRERDGIRRRNPERTDKTSPAWALFHDCKQNPVRCHVTLVISDYTSNRVDECHGDVTPVMLQGDAQVVSNPLK